MSGPRHRQAMSDRQIELLREHLDRKHLRLEKMIRASTRQAATATASALQQQLQVMQKNLLVGLQSNGLQDGSFNPLPGAMPAMPSPKLTKLGSVGSIDRLTADPFSDFEDDPLSDDDEDAARLRYERSEGIKKSRSNSETKDNVKTAWQEEEAQEEEEKDPEAIEEDDERFRDGDKEFLQKKSQMVVRRNKLDENMPPLRKLARTVVFDHRFEWLVSFIVVFNSLLVGIEAQWGLENLNKDPHMLLRVLDICCNVCFALELALRVTADRRFFISLVNPSLYWNLLDIFLVTFAWLEEIILLIAASESSLDMSVLRLLRMARLLRVARILRVVRFFSDLRVMVNGIKASSRALLWSIVLLSLVTYLFGVTFMQLSRAHLEETGAPGGLLLDHYGTLSRSILTLFMTISGGMLWKEALTPLSEIHWLLDLIFLIYIFCTVFCCLNVMTGIFVEAAQVTKKTDESVVQQELQKERKQWLADVAELFYRVDADSSGDVTKKEFCSQLYTERVQMLFRKLGIVSDGYTPSELWDLLDVAQSGAIVQADFAHAIRQMMGNGRAIDIYRLKKDLRTISRQVGDLNKTMQATFGDSDR
ncbi:NaCP60E [Symbiodinium sp. CCMP2592]|nr:NaCP60E [Symbiodinium sp. CCMP2592]